MLSSFPHVLDVCASFSFLFEDLGQFYQSLKETSKGSQAVNHSSCLEEGNGEEKEKKKAILFELSQNGGQACVRKEGFRNKEFQSTRKS